jgi:p90 ribosomal S6 kinase
MSSTTIKTRPANHNRPVSHDSFLSFFLFDWIQLQNQFYFALLLVPLEHIDSPGVPPSANAHELFRGFSFVAPTLLEDIVNNNDGSNNNHNMTQPNPLNTNNNNHTNVALGNANAKSGATQTVQSVMSRLQSSGVFEKGRGVNSLQDYEFEAEIGRGAFSICYRCVHKDTKQQLAVKRIDKSKRDCSEEVEILLRFGQHPNIVTLHTVYESPEHVYLFMELCEGGELLDRILARKFFSERQASEVLEVLASAVNFLHEHGVVHRDLKPSNVVYADRSDNARALRICDFGFAKQMRAGNGLLMTPCYTANFVAPEVLRRQGYDQACDVWSMGVLLFTMLAGHPPFTSGPDDTPDRILKRISEVRLLFPHTLSSEAKHVLLRMLHVDPKQRYRTAEVLSDSFVAQRLQLPATNLAHTGTGNAEPITLIKKNLGRVFDAMHTPNTVVRLDPVLNSTLAKRRARTRSNV